MKHEYLHWKYLDFFQNFAEFKRFWCFFSFRFSFRPGMDICELVHEHDAEIAIWSWLFEKMLRYSKVVLDTWSENRVQPGRLKNDLSPPVDSYMVQIAELRHGLRVPNASARVFSPLPPRPASRTYATPASAEWALRDAAGNANVPPRLKIAEAWGILNSTSDSSFSAVSTPIFATKYSFCIF